MVVLTKILYPKCRLIRQPFYCRGLQHIDLGIGLTTGRGVRLDALPTRDIKAIKFGSNVQLNDYVHIAAIDNVTIGNNVLIASRVFISDHNHGRFDGDDIVNSPMISPELRPLSSSPVFIGDNVWVGENVCILPGLTIGRGAVIGAGSVVTKNVPENSVVAGNPAKVIRIFDTITNKWLRV